MFDSKALLKVAGIKGEITIVKTEAPTVPYATLTIEHKEKKQAPAVFTIHNKTELPLTVDVQFSFISMPPAELVELCAAVKHGNADRILQAASGLAVLCEKEKLIT